MSSDDTTVDDFLVYTKHWINKVNCGGLFQLNTFMFFTSIVNNINVLIQHLLPAYLAHSAASDSSPFKDCVIKTNCAK